MRTFVAMHLMVCDDPIIPLANGSKKLGTITFVIGVVGDVQSKSRIGRPIPEWDWMILKSVQTKSQIGRPICDTLLSRIGLPIQVTDWASKP